MGQFDSFYEGSMSPPLTVDGRLIPTPTTLSPAQIYAGIYPSNPMPQMSSIGPGPGPSGGYSFLQDMIDASTPSVPRIPGPNNTTVANKSGVRLPSTPAALDPMEAYAGVPKTSAQRAIDITVNGGVPLPRVRPTPTVPIPSSPWGPSWALGINPFMQWDSAPPSASDVPPGSDPWGRLRANGYATTPNRPGMITGPRPVSGHIGAPAGNSLAPSSALPGTAFLNERGINTQGLTIGQQANELNKQLAGSSRNADGSRGFGV